MSLKKYLCFILCFILTFSVFPLTSINVNASTEYLKYEINGANITYFISQDEEIYIIDCEETISGNLVIPSEINGYPVALIGSSAFRNCKNLTSVTIPEGVYGINNRAFLDCTNITSIILPSTATKIDDLAFCGTSIKSMSLPYGTEFISNGLFRCCSKLEHVDIPNTVNLIESEAFYYCESLKSIDIPESVTQIGVNVFYNCDSLRAIKTPFLGETLTATKNPTLGHLVGTSWVDDIGRYASRYLTKVEITKDTSIDYGAFLNCDQLATVIIPDTVTAIREKAFYDCDSLTEIVIPDSVKSISPDSFSECNKLTIYCNVGPVSEILTKRTFNYKCFGDLDDNESLSGTDTVMMKKALLDYADFDYDEKIADMNQDTAFNVIDLIHLKKMILKTVS